uniref:NADH-ubiquinone oxidoreductase chain 2 n=1 Tax=Tineola bisselliella TaxID=93883 RepID=A0A076E9Y9_TINBI|nr:NADH dehydrogenase subunit 2 [Tineola bisselliella]
MQFENNNNKMFFYFILFFSTMISISSNSWLGCWIGLEINLLSFIPIITINNNLMSSEASLKYFLIQSIASMNFLFIILMNMILFKLFFFNNFLNIMLNSSLIMKMGAAPFHFWFPSIIEGLSWLNCFILMTWQKISPLILLSYYFHMKFLYFIMLITIIVGSLSGLNQTSLRKLLTFSSINHLGWLILSIIISENLWLIYMLIYTFLLMIMCMMFYLFNTFFLNQLFFNNFNKMTKLLIFLNLLSLGGLPPFLGFFPKWIIINFMIYNNMIILTFIFICMSLIMLFFYIRITYSSFMFNYFKLKWYSIFIKKNLMNFINLLMFFSLISLILTTFFF